MTTIDRDAARTGQSQPPPSKNERLKVASQGLGGPLFTDFADETTANISGDAAQLLKFHGSYQQDDRDERAARRGGEGGRDWSFMIRTKFPGGRLSAEQYVIADEIATTLANGTIRITTRQDFQYHGVGKRNVKKLIRLLNEHWMTTYGGCGDITRNTLTCPVSDLLPGVQFDLQELAQRVSDRFMADSTAYYELWLDGEKFLADGTRVKVTPNREESFYGPTYMPRKHKIGIGLPHDNCIDIFTHDLALEAVLDQGGALQGFNLIAGGGLGHTHGQTATFPRLGDRIGFLPPDEAMRVLEEATAIYRDYGDRSNRRHARLKYVLADRGVAWFQEELGKRLGAPLAPAAPVVDYGVADHLGWHEQADGRWLVGVFVENGRIKDTPEWQGKTALRSIVERFQPGVRLTAQQNIILTDIDASAKDELDALLSAARLSTGNGSLSALRRHAMACPALPTCGLAVAESERYLPDLITRLEERGNGADRVGIRMAGCPNSCSRPPTAEVGIIGRSLGLYNVYLGGSFEGTRLTRLYRANVTEEQLPNVLGESFDQWKATRQPDEAHGDWANRVLFADGDRAV